MQMCRYNQLSRDKASPTSPFKLPPFERCECGHTSQTVRLIPMECRKFSHLRQEIWKEEQRKEEEDVNTPTVHKESCRFHAKDPLAKAVPES